MRALVAGFCAVVLLSPAAMAAATKTAHHKAAPAKSSLFDAPLQTLTRTLPAAKGHNKTVITCRYYAHFMVKQVDEGEVGAAQLSIVPLGGSAKPACQRPNVASEKVVSPRDWSGYFKGVKGDYVLFDADDGVNGGLGFAVIAAATAKKRFEDSAVGALKGVALAGDVLTLRYARSYSAECSVPTTATPAGARSRRRRARPVPGSRTAPADISRPRTRWPRGAARPTGNRARPVSQPPSRSSTASAGTRRRPSSSTTPRLS